MRRLAMSAREADEKKDPEIVAREDEKFSPYPAQ